MLIFDQLNKGDRALRTVAWAALAGLLLLGLQLWRLQVFAAAKYRQSLETQSFRTVRVPAQRGKILDRNGRELVGNSPRYRLDLYLDELRPQFEAEYRRRKPPVLAAKNAAAGEPVAAGFFARLFDNLRHKKRGVRLTREEIGALERQARYAVVSNTVAVVGARLGTPLGLGEEALQRHYLQKRFLPLALVTNCSPQQVAVIIEQGWTIPGVTLEQVAVRSYPHGLLAAHLAGYLTRNDNYDEAEGPFDYRLPDYVGGIGLEAAFDHELRGVAGAKSILVNSAGYRHSQAEEILAAPHPGQNLVTTLDLDVQAVTEKALNSVKAGDERGAVVVMNPANGDVLALASAPAFDPGEFIGGVSLARWTNFFMAEPARPLFNRATYGEYAPGSTFKILHALALLENGLNPAEVVTVGPDPRNPNKGAYILGNRSIGDTAVPGDYDFHRAFIRSSNTYFIHFGLRLGWERLLGMGHRFGLGRKTGLSIGEEARGFLPTIEEVRDRNLNLGQLANVCIGQDQITVTPIQMAVAISAVANGGKVFWPRVVDRLEPGDTWSGEKPVAVKAGQIRSELNLPRPLFDLVRAAMRDDVADDEGTGKASRLKDFAVCGKTGTAEIKGNGRKDKVTWFTSFAPYEAPRYVVIVMVESGGSGGGTCAPVARQIYQFLRDRELGLKQGVAAR